MIGRLKGILLTKQPPTLLLDVNGVGYEVDAPMSTFYQLPDINQEVILHTHLVVREDVQQLCGFATEAERSMFRSLIKINGVGPKLALSILSAISADDFARCIQNNDTTTLVRLPGVGKKTAERLVIEMRDKLKDWQTGLSEQGKAPAGMIDIEHNADPVEEAVSALIALGYKPPQASRMVTQIDSHDLSSEEIIRDALKASIIK
ncbi:MAG: Holliday junction branch migration protein RuvA [Gammaproteobacteria bacterium]|nr:Holliday junction branch migration protein RuvA [Gammaproteobacteria bacterium]